MLAQHSHVIDPLIEPTIFRLAARRRRLEAELARTLGETRSYEEMLDAIAHVRPGAHVSDRRAHPVGIVSAEQAGRAVRRSCRRSASRAACCAQEDFAERHGRIRGQQTAILALGRLGAREMTASSDLDLIVVYDFDGKHPEFGRQTPALRRAVFRPPDPALDQRADGADQLRRALPGRHAVRPSGRSGPLATQIDGFVSYQEGEAWTWEHMALTRARVVSAPPEFAARVETAIRSVLVRPRNAHDRSRRRRDAGRDREGKRRRRCVGPQVRTGRTGRYRIHCAVSATGERRSHAGHPRHLDGADAGKGRASRRAGRAGRSRPAARRCGSITT